MAPARTPRPAAPSPEPGELSFEEILAFEADALRPATVAIPAWGNRTVTLKALTVAEEEAATRLATHPVTNKVDEERRWAGLIEASLLHPKLSFSQVGRLFAEGRWSTLEQLKGAINRLNMLGPAGLESAKSGPGE